MIKIYKIEKLEKKTKKNKKILKISRVIFKISKKSYIKKILKDKTEINMSLKKRKKSSKLGQTS